MFLLHEELFAIAYHDTTQRLAEALTCECVYGLICCLGNGIWHTVDASGVFIEEECLDASTFKLQVALVSSDCSSGHGLVESNSLRASARMYCVLSQVTSSRAGFSRLPAMGAGLVAAVVKT